MIGEILASVGVTTWLIVVLTAIIGYWFLSTTPGFDKLPPTVAGRLPVLGHLTQLKKCSDPRKQFLDWAKQYGSAFTIYLGSNPVVVINGYKALQETFVKQANHVSDRPKGFGHYVFPDIHLGILSASGVIWKEQRTTSLSILRKFGMGKNSLAEKILEEIEIFSKSLKDMDGEASDLRAITNIAVSNVTCNIIFGRRYDYSDKMFLNLMSLLNDLVRLVKATNILNFYPSLRKLPRDPFGASSLYNVGNSIREFINNKVDELKSRYDSSNSMESFVSAYLKEMEIRDKANENHLLDEQNLGRVVNNLFVAGTETTSTTILWNIIYMINYPDIQEKVHKEIVELVGTDRLPNMPDKKDLKYLQAVIMETQRKASILPISLTHSTSGEVTVDDYVIPAGVTVIPHLESVLSDPEVWGDPENFRPERFLDDTGNVVKKEEFIPFSLGWRVCLGESLAKMELFLFMAAMLQRFKFVAEDPEHPPPLKEVYGVTCPPVGFKVHVIERKF